MLAIKFASQGKTTKAAASRENLLFENNEIFVRVYQYLGINWKFGFFLLFHMNTISMYAIDVLFKLFRMTTIHSLNLTPKGPKFDRK